MTYQTGGYGQSPYETSSSKSSARTKDRWVIAGTVAGVVVMLGLGAGAIYLITKKDPAPAGPPAVAQPTVDPLAAAAAQQFADAVAAADPAVALPVICAPEKAELQTKKPGTATTRAKVTGLSVSGSAGTFTLEQTAKEPTKLRLVKEADDWKVCSGNG